MAGSARGQDEANPIMPLLAIRAVKMELSCPLGIARYPRAIIINPLLVKPVYGLRLQLGP